MTKKRQASADAHREVVELSADAFFQADHDARFTDVNQAACRLVGYDRDELLSKTIFDLIPTEDRSRLQAVKAELLVPGYVHRGEWTLTRKDGIYVPVEASANSLSNGRWQAFVRDISERKRIEDELKAANAFLDSIIEHIPLVLFLKDGTSLQYLRLNRAAEDLLGWPKKTFIGKNDYDLWPHAQAEGFVAKDREALTGKLIEVAEESIQTRYQGVRLLRTKKVPILDTAGRPMYLLGISEDITERRRIEKEQQFLAEVSVVLSASLDYERTLTNLARLVVQHLADWTAVDVSDEHGRLSLLTVASSDPDQAELCKVLERMPPDRDLPHIMRSVIETRQPIVVEHVTPQYIESLAQTPGHLQALQAMRAVSFIAVPLLIRGQPRGALFLGSSQVSRVYGQADRRLAEALADRAAMAIENARLYRASVQATQLRDQVLSVVAHDLRNPLAAILLQAGALKRHGSGPDRRSQKRSDAIHRAATRMNRLIQDLLDVALMEAGQLTIEPARLSVRELIVNAVEMQRPLASSSSLQLHLDVDGDVPDIRADRDRLLQVFENLIGNAIKFTKAGGCITVGATSQDHEVIFRVADTGSGIAPDDLARVFDRFWQATSSRRLGAGLGLPITKGIVEAHGGRIWVESAPNCGTTFSFAIPKASPEQDRSSEPCRGGLGTARLDA